MENSKSLKILFCPAHYRFTDRSGSEFYSAYNLANRISIIHPQSVVVTGKSDVQSSVYGVVQTNKYESENWMLDLSSWSTLSSILFAIKYMYVGYAQTRKKKFDLIHHIRPFVFGSTFNLLPFLPGNRKTPFVIGEFCAPYSNSQLQGEQNFSLKEKIVRILVKFISPILHYLSRATIRRADAVLVTEEHTKKLLSDYVNIDKIFVIPHAKDKNEYHFDQNKFQSNTIKILIAGRLIPRKRFDLAIRSFAIANSRNENLQLMIAGDGPEKENLVRLTQELKIADSVVFLGNVPYKEMPLYFSNANIFLHTASEEVFGHVYVEALASGTPIVSTKTIGAMHIVNPSVGKISSDDPEQIANDILDVSRDKNVLRRLGINSREIFENKYDYDGVVIPEILSIYKKLINKQ